MEKLEQIVSGKGYQITENGLAVGKRGNFLSNFKTPEGYNSFSVRFNNKIKLVKVHRLQAYQKYGNKLYDEGIVVRHLDNDKLNNSWDNIVIGTQSENMLDIPEQIRIKKAIHASSFITKYNHKEVIEFYNTCKSYKKTMEKFNITSKGTLNYILKSSCGGKEYTVV